MSNCHCFLRSLVFSIFATAIIVWVIENVKDTFLVLLKHKLKFEKPARCANKAIKKKNLT